MGVERVLTKKVTPPATTAPSAMSQSHFQKIRPMFRNSMKFCRLSRGVY